MVRGLADSCPQDGSTTGGPHNSGVDDYLLDSLRVRYNDEALPMGVRLDSWHTWVLAHKRMGRVGGGLWDPVIALVSCSIV